MPRRMHRRRKHSRRRREAPSVSIATYQDIVNLDVSATAANRTFSSFATLSQVKNDSGETVNRKILRVSGELAWATQPAAGFYTLGMFALWAHPEAQDLTDLSGFDPFASGPDGAATSYEGRPHPRPFGRRLFVHAVQQNGQASQLFREFSYRTRAERLLRPGWQLTAGVWVRTNASTGRAKLAGPLSVVVAG